MKLKVGDKVKIINFPIADCIGKIYILTSVSPFTSCFAGRVELSGYGNTLVYKKEIEKVPRKGEQLLLFEL